MKRVTLPARSFEVHPGFIKGRRIGIGVCLVMVVGMSALAIFFAMDAFAMRREQAIWATGQPAIHATADGTEKIKFVFVNYRIRVSYEVAGIPHRGDQEFATIFGGASTFSQPVVRYDADRPGEFATSWGIEAASGRWRWLAIMDSFLAFVVAVMARQLRRSRREIREMRALASTGDEVVATVVSRDRVKLSNGRETPHAKVRWRAGLHEPLTTQLDTRMGDIARTAAKDEAVALLSEDGSRGVLLRDDLYPLVATGPEIEAARQLRQRA